MKNIFTLLLTCQIVGSYCQTPILYKDFSPGTPGSSANFTGHHLIKINNYIVFGAREASSGWEGLFSIDGNGNTERLLQDDEGYFDEGEMVVYNNKLYFAEGSNWYETDGTASGTSQISTLPSGWGLPQDMTEHNGKIYFYETANGRLAQFNPGNNQITPISDTITNIKEIVSTNVGFYVMGRSTAYGDELFKLNLNEDGLELFFEGKTGPNSGGVSALRAAGNNLFFAAFNSSETGNARRCWLSDGTINGTQMINPNWKAFNANSAKEVRADQFLSHKGMLYFNADTNNSNVALAMMSDGTVSGTRYVVDKLDFARKFVGADNYIYMYYDADKWTQYDIANDTLLFVQDSTILTETQASNTFDFVGANAIGDSLFYIASAPTIGAEPYLFEGDNTQKPILLNINAGTADAGHDYCNFVELNGAVYFSVQDADHGMELWCIGCIPDTATSVLETHMYDNISIYPNPSDGLYTIQSNIQLSRLEVFSATGERIIELRGNATQFNLTDFQTGIYFMKITTEEGAQSTRKIIKY